MTDALVTAALVLLTLATLAAAWWACNHDNDWETRR